jgi:hypothetical protein
MSRSNEPKSLSFLRGWRQKQLGCIAITGTRPHMAKGAGVSRGQDSNDHGWASARTGFIPLSAVNIYPSLLMSTIRKATSLPANDEEQRRATVVMLAVRLP